MDILGAMRTFRRVAELGSFSAAADALGLSNGAVSKLVSGLESHLSVQLIHRTTRRLSLTDEGRSYLQRCCRILDDIEESEAELTQARTQPKGVLRINAPVSFTMLHLGPVFAEFLKRYPDLHLDLSLSDRFVDVVDEGFDLALRIARDLPDSSLVARRIAPVEHVVCAAPAYLERAGVPQTPEDLLNHECLLYTQSGRVGEWLFDGPQKAHAVAVTGRYQSNNSVPLRDALLAGIGVMLAPAYYVEPYLQSGEVRQILKKYKTRSGSLYAVYPHSRHLSAKVRVFIDFLTAALKPRGKLAN